MKLKNYTENKKLLCYWKDKKNYLVQYRMLNLYVRHGMVFDKIHEMNSFDESK